jgi:hypothetical protein
MTTPNLQSNEAPPFVTKADFEDFLASYKTDLEAFATKTDLEAFATKTDLEAFATKTDLEAFATKTDLEAFATKTDLEAFATKTDLEAFATKISKTLLDALAADKEDRLNIQTMADSRMDVLESLLNSIRPSIRYDDSEESCMF